MNCKHCGKGLRKRESGHNVCTGSYCQLIHDADGEALGWSVGAGSVTGDILPYRDAMALWGRLELGADGLNITHVAAIVGIAMNLALRNYEKEIIAALAAQMK